MAGSFDFTRGVSMWRAMIGMVVLAVGATSASADSVREGPKLVSPQYADVGRLAPDLAGTDLSGRAFKLSDFAKGKKAVVIAVTSISCPISKKYLPTLAKLEAEFAPKGVGFVYLNPIATDKPDANSVKGPYLHDANGALAKQLGAKSTGDVFLLDARRTVAYRGAVDDQYGLGYSLDEPRKTYLADALRALLADRDIAVAATEAPGCELDLSSAKAPNAPAVTYHNRISRIVQRHCLECHRGGGAAPFSLASHEDLVAHKGMIRKVVERGTMPPWFASAEKDGHDKWSNDPSLAADAKADLLTWLANGTPAGDPADAPLPRPFPKDWAIGTPDLVLELPQPIDVKATGTMPYQNVTVDTKLAEDKWVRAFEIRPTAPAVVHHVLVFRAEDRPRGLLGRGDASEDRAGFFAAYVPGNTHQVFPDGFCKKLAKGSKLHFQIHYTPNGTATQDRLRIGLKFADAPPKHELKVVGLANNKIDIPPGAGNHQESAGVRVPANAVLTAFMPHMHLRGKACKYELVAGEKTVTLLDIPKYDFNWQLRYELAEPVSAPRGSLLGFTAWFDNSDENPANPDPTQRVKWGQQTYDEMLLGYVEYYIP